MEVKEVDRMIISKPVASRPNFTGFRLELLAGHINVSPPSANLCYETAVAAIKPKTVRVKPTISQAPLAKELQADTSEAGPNCKANISRVHNQSTIFKPLAKVVSKATFSFLANLRSSEITRQQALSQFGVSARPDKLQFYSNSHSSNLSQDELSQSVEPTTMAQQMLDEEPRMMASSTAGADRRSCDGYNWRKYGQKQVKGSEFPRSYYKCTHPKCHMKKKVERSLDGQIKEIVYKGEHNHPKLDHSKRNVSGIQGQELAIAGTDQDHISNYKCTPPKCQIKKKAERSLDGKIKETFYKGEHNHPKLDHSKRNVAGIHIQELAIAGTDKDHNSSDPKLYDNICEENEGVERQMENEDSVQISKQPLFFGNYVPLCYHPVDTEEHKAGDRTAVDPAGGRGCEEADNGLKVDDNGTKNKRRKQDNQNNEAGKSGKGVLKPRILVHNNSEPELMGDGFRWRKYGQKIVRGNPYPRSYYRCTSPKCNVRKHVERALDDPGTFITTYEGRHNHEMPMKIMNSTAEPETQVPTVEDER